MKITVNKLKEVGTKEKPKAANHQVSQRYYIKELGSSSSSGQQPKFYNQAIYARNVTKSTFMSMKTQSMTFYKQYTCVRNQKCKVHQNECASDAQLNDVSRFCAIPKQGVAETLSVDLTFKLGEFYVLVTSFKNPMVINQ